MEFTDFQGKTALMVSIFVGEEEAFDILLEAGADPFATNTRDKKFRTIDYSVQSLGSSGLHFAQTLADRSLSLESYKRYAPDLFVIAVIAQRFELADWLLTQNINLFRLHVEVNPLGFAIIAHSLPAVRYLIKTDLRIFFSASLASKFLSLLQDLQKRPPHCNLNKHYAKTVVVVCFCEIRSRISESVRVAVYIIEGIPVTLSISMDNG